MAVGRLTETHTETQGLYVDCEWPLENQTEAHDSQQPSQGSFLWGFGNQLLQHLAHGRASNLPAKLCILVRLGNEVGAATAQAPTIHHNSFAVKGTL